MLHELTLADIPVDFDEQQYVKDRPEARAFQQTYCRLHAIPDRIRLYVHYLRYSDATFDFQALRSLFIAADYDNCYKTLVAVLDRLVNQKNYYPLGYWLVQSAKQINKTEELQARLLKLKNYPVGLKCLNALTAGHTNEHSSRLVVFYAFNHSYFNAFVASLVSFVVSNAELLPRIVFVIGTESKGVIADLTRLLERLAVNYEILDMDVYAALPLKENYGAATEFKLDRSAYYRIFVLQHILAKYADYHNALYLDADTLVLDKLSDLLTSSYPEPLVACSETQDCELVKKSKLLNGIETYFNSGVLLFGLQHTQLNDCLAKTLKAITCVDRLFLQDQCALNIGFNGHVSSLPEKYNYMLHTKSVISLDDRLAVLHFTGRFKPWESDYQDNSLLGSVWRTFAALSQNF